MTSETAEPSNTQSKTTDSGATFVRRGYRVGDVLAGKYRIERVIGEGAMGVVLAATHLGLDETVAIKFIRADLQHVPGMLSRFAREAKISARIRSEHVVKVLDVGECESIGPYIVMEYLEGESLATLGDAQCRLPVQRAVEYTMQACQALAAAHRIGVTHRDIKPENLFLTLEGDLEVIKLLDFGISKASLTGRVFGDDLALAKTSCVVGTPLYMSPEQIRSVGNVDHRADIWSIGAVLYELVTGQTAFKANGVTEICAAILELPTPQIAEICPAAPAALQSILDRCLQKDPADRFQTVAQLALALSPLAPAHARSYAQRSSSILRGSSLDLAALEAVASDTQRPNSTAREPRRATWLAVAAGLPTIALFATISLDTGPLFGPVIVPNPPTASGASSVSIAPLPLLAVAAQSVSSQSVLSQSTTPRSVTPRSVQPLSSHTIESILPVEPSAGPGTTGPSRTVKPRRIVERPAAKAQAVAKPIATTRPDPPLPKRRRLTLVGKSNDSPRRQSRRIRLVD